MLIALICGNNSARFSAARQDSQCIERYLSVTWADPEGVGVVGTDPLEARLIIFAMLKFSVRPLMGIWTTLRKFFGSTHG